MSARGTLGPLLVGIRGPSLEDSERAMLAHPWVGGVILFSRNYLEPAQLIQLCQDIRDLRSPRLLICVDQEGGRVQRFREGFTPLPPLAVLGRWYARHPARALDLAYRHGRVMSAEVLGHGVDLSLAPVLDLGGVSEVIGDRAMADAPETVSALAGHYLGGMHDSGMAACGKHFPGHGSVAPDTHLETVCDDRSRESIERDLEPFRVHAGRLAAVMPAHVCYRQLDDRPAGFSPVWIGQVLRSELGFAGVVISDDLDMVAAASAGTSAERLGAALDAGCDLALVCDPDSAAGLVAELVPELAAHPPDRSDIIGTLYGRPAFSLEEQLTVPEFRAWRDSLRQLAEGG